MAPSIWLYAFAGFICPVIGSQIGSLLLRNSCESGELNTDGSDIYFNWDDSSETKQSIGLKNKVGSVV
ncbi:hypothetical protein VP1G_11346 [Cytospora mali]|uniref:Uncharacterized protein n=1 Tax=Cytospora mali TaxID=578113 RepID=A0A194VDB2_CYTMA|nr:hypothetical protein VP1G_11346 [Valsa mali var. pyri (nom. inval.)]